MKTLAEYLDNLENDTRMTLFKSTGPGGQHKNKTESAVRLQHLPTGLMVTAVESRSQSKNKKVAWERLILKLEKEFKPKTPRVPTKLPGRVREYRLKMKKKRSQLKIQRKKPDRNDQAFCVVRS
ncbi:MAG: peptide chain release factor-like protein [Deferribacteres bacterium]|nr:peptide chain release factor-like protein [Deferribacteres bacterium]